MISYGHRDVAILFVYIRKDTKTYLHTSVLALKNYTEY